MILKQGMPWSVMGFTRHPDMYPLFFGVRLRVYPSPFLELMTEPGKAGLL